MLAIVLVGLWFVYQDNTNKKMTFTQSMYIQKEVIQK